MNKEIKLIIDDIMENKNYYSSGNWISELLSKEMYEKYKLESIHEATYEQSRWSIDKGIVYEITRKSDDEKIGYIEATWSDPATEMQEGQDTYLEVFEVEPEEVTVVKYLAVE